MNNSNIISEVSGMILDTVSDMIFRTSNIEQREHQLSVSGILSHSAPHRDGPVIDGCINRGVAGPLVHDIEP